MFIEFTGFRYYILDRFILLFFFLGYCVKGGWREEEERVKERVRRSVNPIPNSDPDPKQAPQMSLKEA
jgi:hypothetical protein